MGYNSAVRVCVCATLDMGGKLTCGDTVLRGHRPGSAYYSSSGLQCVYLFGVLRLYQGAGRLTYLLLASQFRHHHSVRVSHSLLDEYQALFDEPIALLFVDLSSRWTCRSASLYLELPPAHSLPEAHDLSYFQDMFQNPLLSTNPREFWVKWNLAVKNSLQSVVFLLVQGKKPPPVVQRLKKDTNAAKKKFNDQLSETEVSASDDDAPAVLRARASSSGIQERQGPYGDLKKRNGGPAANGRQAPGEKVEKREKPRKKGSSFLFKAAAALATFAVSGAFHEWVFCCVAFWSPMVRVVPLSYAFVTFCPHGAGT